MRRILAVLGLLFVVTTTGNADVLVDNFSEATGGGIAFRHPAFSGASYTWAQPFNTGGSDYRLNWIEMSIYRDTTTADFTAKLWTPTTSGSLPANQVVDFSLANSPSDGAFETYRFVPNTQFTLNGSTEYFFSLENNLGVRSYLGMTVTTSHNWTGPGSIANHMVVSADSGSNWQVAGSNASVIRIDCSPVSVPEPATGFICLATAVGWLATRRRRLVLHG